MWLFSSSTGNKVTVMKKGKGKIENGGRAHTSRSIIQRPTANQLWTVQCFYNVLTNYCILIGLTPLPVLLSSSLIRAIENMEKTMEKQWTPARWT